MGAARKGWGSAGRDAEAAAAECQSEAQKRRSEGSRQAAPDAAEGGARVALALLWR